MPKVAITGAYLSQNMGSAAMAQVACRRLKAQGYDVELFAKYPEDDRPLAEREGIPLRTTRQIRTTFVFIPLLFLARLVPGARGWVRRRWFADIVLFYDLGGITFAESRGLQGFLINATWLLMPLLLGIPVIKGSQALGPFKSWYLRLFGPPLLRRADRIHTRGALTHAMVEEAAIPAQRASDIAFLLEPEPDGMEELLPTDAPAPVTVIPSSVVKGRMDARHGEGRYLDLISALIRWLREEGHEVALLAHSYRRGETLNSNDYPLCRALKERFPDDGVRLYDVFGTTPGNLKHLVSRSRVVVTGRFHGMVAALGTATPAVVTGWSHKYREVLDELGVAEQAVAWQEVDEATLIDMTRRTLDQEEALRARMRERLPGVRESAERNFQGIADVIGA